MHRWKDLVEIVLIRGGSTLGLDMPSAMADAVVHGHAMGCIAESAKDVLKMFCTGQKNMVPEPPTISFWINCRSVAVSLFLWLSIGWPRQIYLWLSIGWPRQIYAETKMNKHSSRSHALLQVKAHRKRLSASPTA